MPDNVIPAGGRDVQCSNCGNSWFVKPGGDEQPAVAAPRTPTVRTKPQPRAPYPPQERDLDEAPPVVEAPATKPVPQDVKRVLQQEAARELNARQSDVDLEVQEDLGLEEPGPTREDYASDAAQAERRSRLPDIEEINSTLAATPMPQREKHAATPLREDALPRRKLGFRFGFVLALFILAVLTALYVFAPNLTEMFPTLADQVNTYVFWINDIRQWLFETTEGLLQDLQEAGTTPAA